MALRQRVIDVLANLGKALFVIPQNIDARDSFSVYARKEIEDSVDTFRNEFAAASLFSNREALQAFAIKQALQFSQPHFSNRLFAEFGVRAADSLNRFARLLKPHGVVIHGFDSFVGIEEDWKIDRPAGAMAQAKIPATESNAQLVIGPVQDTLSQFLEANSDSTFSFIHMDMDTYKPTRYALDLIKPYLTADTFILFDELHGYPGWRHHEYKALHECFRPETFSYVAFGKQQALIRVR